jgi:hypothetical protein
MHEIDPHTGVLKLALDDAPLALASSLVRMLSTGDSSPMDVWR